MRTRQLRLLAGGMAGLVTAMFLTGSCCLPTRLRYGFVNSPSPLWTTDLRPLGFYVNENNPTGVITAITQIAFGSNDELVVLSEEGALPGDPNKVRAFVLEAASGKVVRQRDWVAGGRPAVFATAKGRYVADTFKALVLYSPGLETVIARYDDNVEMASPDGRAITVWLPVPGRAVTRFLDADTLKPTGAEFINEDVESIAFDRTATVDFDAADNAAVVIDDAHHEVPEIETDCSEVRPRFISQDVVAVFGCGRLRVVTVEGQTLFTSASSNTNCWVAPASRDGRRFAVIDTCESAAHWSTVCFERVKVLDSKTGHVDFRAEFRDVRGTLGGSGVALSPDGGLVAVNSLGIVRVFAIVTEP